MADTLNSFPDKMTKLRHTADKGSKEIEFWSAREIQPEFGYDRWENFEAVIGKGIENCSKINADPRHHFAKIAKMVPIGSGAMREQTDYVLSRTACYLIALNGESSKKEIAWGAYLTMLERSG